MERLGRLSWLAILCVLLGCGRSRLQTTTNSSHELSSPPPITVEYSESEDARVGNSNDVSPSPPAVNLAEFEFPNTPPDDQTLGQKEQEQTHAIAQVEVSTTQLEFGTVLPGTTTNQTLVSISNTGNAETTNLRIIGSNTVFAFEHDCPANLAVGSRCTIKISARPPQGIAYSESLWVSTETQSLELNARVRGKNRLIVGAGTGGGPHIKGFGGIPVSFLAYENEFHGGVYVAQGDTNGDGVTDIITGPGSGGGPLIRVFDGNNPKKVLHQFHAYDPAFSGGVRVASADVTGDGIDDIVTAPGPGGAAHIKVFDGSDASQVHSFLAYPSTHTNGFFIAAADFNGDGHADIVTSFDAHGEQFALSIRVFDGVTLEKLYEFHPNMFVHLGARIALADLDGDTVPEVIVAGGVYRSWVRIYKMQDQTVRIISLLAPFWRGGSFDDQVELYVATCDLNGDQIADLIVGADAGGGPHVKVYDGVSLTRENTSGTFESFLAFDGEFGGGVRVASCPQP